MTNPLQPKQFFLNFFVKFGGDVHLGGKRTRFKGFFDLRMFKFLLPQKMLWLLKASLAVQQVLYVIYKNSEFPSILNCN